MSVQDEIVSSVVYTAPAHVHLSSHELQLLDTYKQKVEQWGWRWQQHDSSIQLTASGSILDTLMGATDLQVVIFTLCLYPELEYIIQAQVSICRHLLCVRHGDKLLLKVACCCHHACCNCNWLACPL